MGIQAAIAISISELISMYFYIDRGYWITATAMALTTQTWGESVKRSFERVGMTILGGIVGTILYFIVPHYPWVLGSILLVFVFLNVYLLKIYSLFSVFFLTCFVVFLFALLGSWNFVLLQSRVIDTLIGALIALIVSCFFFSEKTDVYSLFSNYLQKMQASLAAAVHQKQPKTLYSEQVLMTEFYKIKKSAISIRYELLFHRLNSKDFSNLLNEFALSTQLLTHITLAYDWLAPHLSISEKKIISIAAEATVQNFSIIIKNIEENKKKDLLPVEYLSTILRNSIQENPQRFASLESDALGFFNLIYFFSRLNKNLKEISSLFTRA